MDIETLLNTGLDYVFAKAQTIGQELGVMPPPKRVLVLKTIDTPPTPPKAAPPPPKQVKNANVYYSHGWQTDAEWTIEQRENGAVTYVSTPVNADKTTNQDRPKWLTNRDLAVLAERKLLKKFEDARQKAAILKPFWAKGNTASDAEKKINKSGFKQRTIEDYFSVFATAFELEQAEKENDVS